MKVNLRDFILRTRADSPRLRRDSERAMMVAPLIAPCKLNESEG
jgi:hypothetical protein